MSSYMMMNPSKSHFAWVNQTTNDSDVWELEKVLHVPNWVNWMDSSPMFSTYVVTTYLVAIFLGQSIMRNRKAFNLKDSLCAWNGFLAVFSFLGALRTIPPLLETLGGKYGFHNSVCTRGTYDPVNAFWSLIFTLSKVIELGDTAFIVLKKKPLLFLHWFHHLTVLLYVWTTFTAFNANGTVFMAMNFFIHTIMYTYYVLKLRGFRVPKMVSIVVTFLQIVQMIVGVTVNVYSLYVKSNGLECSVKTSHVYGCLAMYAAYLVLFSNYFAKSYVVPKAKSIKMD